MNSSRRTVVAVSLAIAVLTSVLFVGPVAGLGWDRGETGADPDTAGSIATYRVVLIAEADDAIVANGLGRVVLLFGADPDFSGSVAGVTASDVRVSVDDGTEVTAAGRLRAAPNAAGDRLRITLSTPASVSAGDRIVVEVRGIESSALSVADAERFGLRTKTFDPTGTRDARKVFYTLRAGESDPGTGEPSVSDTFALSQGESCVPLTPLGDGTETVAAFYDYRSPYTDPTGWYTSYGTTALQTTDTSQVFLYRGSDGLSLVFLHDRTKAGAETGGGTVDADVSGLPAGSEWAVEDDEYPGRDDVFTLGGSNAHAEWVWNDGTRTDGGAIRLGSEGGLPVETLSVNAQFNEASSRYPYEKWKSSPEDNHLDRWIARSGDGTTHALAMDRAIAIRSGTCD